MRSAPPSGSVRRWLKGLPLTRYADSLALLAGAMSPLAAASLVRSAGSTRVLSETARAGLSSFGRCLEERAPADLLPDAAPVQLTYDSARASIGLNELVHLLEVLRRVHARRVFEVGTSSGGTTWHLAANLEPGGEVHTLDLPPDTERRGGYSPRSLATERPTAEQLGGKFAGTEEAARITQHLADSRSFDPGELAGTMDVVFIDGGHTYEIVASDTLLARRLLREGGVLVWHDYFVFHPDYGVRRLLEEQAAAGASIYRFPDSLAAFCVYRSAEWPGR